MTKTKILSRTIKKAHKLIKKVLDIKKIITGTILFLSIFILSNTGAYATDTTSSNTPPSKGYWLKKYIGAVEQKNRIPKGLLSAIAGVESDFNPYAVNIAGKTVIASNQLTLRKISETGINVVTHLTQN